MVLAYQTRWSFDSAGEVILGRPSSRTNQARLSATHTHRHSLLSDFIKHSRQVHRRGDDPLWNWGCFSLLLYGWEAHTPAYTHTHDEEALVRWQGCCIMPTYLQHALLRGRSIKAAVVTQSRQSSVPSACSLSSGTQVWT
uniref:Uncharacterized protein n=1 Tax=Bionectria ochroleuca TaxID=29856 RepID=A0A8H7TVB8_BIOOC